MNPNVRISIQRHLDLWKKDPRCVVHPSPTATALWEALQAMEITYAHFAALAMVTAPTVSDAANTTHDLGYREEVNDRKLAMRCYLMDVAEMLEYDKKTGKWIWPEDLQSAYFSKPDLPISRPSLPQLIEKVRRETGTYVDPVVEAARQAARSLLPGTQQNYLPIQQVERMMEQAFRNGVEWVRRQ